MIQIEKHMHAAHDACLSKQWELASNHAAVIQHYLDGLMDWLDWQEDGKDGEFMEIWMPQQETI